ncbi:MAG: hypothetical protein HOV79_08310 [Hamadaea sp.]|nr:hypothetical protein [Hamadaea sp.]
MRAIAAVGIAAAALVWAAPRVSAGDDVGVRAVSGVSLVNDATRKPILGLSPFTDGTVVDLSRLAGRRVSLRAAISAGVAVRSVGFTLTGAKGSRYKHTDKRAPFFLCGDHVDCPLLVTPDEYELTLQAYNGIGRARVRVGRPSTIRFTVTATPTAAAPLDVLFVGNSLLGTANPVTGQDTPDLVRSLALAAGRSVTVTKAILFNSSLRRTWSEGTAAAALDGTKRYDVIVLQEYSVLVATNLPAATDTLLNLYAPTFARALKPGGRVVLFKNWALANPSPFPSRAAAKAAVDKNYAALSAALATPNLLAPIADAFETVIAAKGVRHLIIPDGKHPTGNALYLDAVTLYGILFRESPRHLADLYLAPADASYLRSVAATAIGY